MGVKKSTVCCIVLPFRLNAAASSKELKSTSALFVLVVFKLLRT